MKALRILLLAALFFTGLAANAFPETFASPEWKKGTITGITTRFIEIDGKLHKPGRTMLIKTLYGDQLGSSSELLRAVEKIYFKEKKGEIVEIRIFGTAQ